MSDEVHIMAKPVRFVKIRTCKECGEWLEPGYKGDICPKCLKKEEKKEDVENEVHDLL